MLVQQHEAIEALDVCQKPCVQRGSPCRRPQHEATTRAREDKDKIGSLAPLPTKGKRVFAQTIVVGRIEEKGGRPAGIDLLAKNRGPLGSWRLAGALGGPVLALWVHASGPCIALSCDPGASR